MTTEHPETGPEIDAAQLEGDDVGDDTGNFIAAVGARDAARDASNKGAQDSHLPDADGGGGQIAHPCDDDGPQDDGDGVQRLRRESARRRLRLQESEAALADAQGETERLSELVGNLLRENVERSAADKMIDPRDLWRVVDLDAVLNADGTGVDPAKVSAAIGEVPAHWLKQSPAIRTGDHGLASGATGRAPAPRRTTWASAIGPLAE